MSLENKSQGPHRFAPGQSGNKGGRPKGYRAFRESFRGKEQNDAIRSALESIILNGKDADRINAAKLYLEYGWGKAPAAPADNAALAKSGSVNLLGKLTREELLAIARGETP